LRRIFEEAETPLDSYFISVVPLGGRHVHHFWRLLARLGIPFITLLDLDREKTGGDWGRIQYVRNQVVKLHGDGKALDFKDQAGTRCSLDDPAYDGLHMKSSRTDLEDLDWWVSFFQNRHDVFFLAPLDLDFSMLGAFPSAYRGQAPSGSGPTLPSDDPARGNAMKQRMFQVLAANPDTAPPDLGSSYTDDERERFTWYKYLFLDRSKPVAHMRALVALDGTEWIDQIPGSLAALVERVHELVGARDNENAE
jgi:hypothetical protein